MEKFALIVAGGIGSRLDKNVPKQFLYLKGIPMLMHTIKRFYDFENKIILIVVLPNKYIDTWEKLCNDFAFSIEHSIVIGGDTRFNSVKNGLALVKNNSLVAIHDAARPFVTKTLIGKCFEETERHGSALPVVGVKESVREIFNETSKPILRDNLKLVQTPQCFFSDDIKNAYNNANRDDFTDDASVYEASGKVIHIIDGEERNIKITTLLDIIIAESLIS